MTVLTTSRLHLREAVEADATFLHRLMTDEAFLRNIGDRGVRTVEDAGRYIEANYRTSYAEHGFGLWVVELPDDGVPVGICGLLRRPGMDDVEIGFAFLPEYRGLGYGREAARGVLKHALEVLRIPRIAAIVNPSNEASIRILTGMNMRYEGAIRLQPDAADVSLYVISD